MELGIALIKKYFPELTEIQEKQFTLLGELYPAWNEKINLISRKDIDQLYLRHILHSLSIAKLIRFKAESQILDLGTGGGFPGIPLAILFPKVKFHLVDRKAKKIMVVNDIVSNLKLENVKAEHITAEELKSKYDFVVNRAVALTEKLWVWVTPLLRRKEINGLPNGLISLKGGDLTEELKPLQKQEYIECIPLNKFFDEEYFETKSIVYIQR